MSPLHTRVDLDNGAYVRLEAGWRDGVIEVEFADGCEVVGLKLSPEQVAQVVCLLLVVGLPE